MKQKLIYWMGVMVGILASPRAVFAPPIGFGFDPTSGLSGKILTPNRDGANDIVFFRFNNPFDSSVSLRIMDLTGSLVASFNSSSGQNQLSWDGTNASGEPAHSGIYIYQLESEDKIFNGAIVVAR